MTENNNNSHRRFLVTPSVILGLSLIISTLIFSGAWRKIKSENQTITVTGSAKKVIVSDLGIMRGTINVEAGSASDAYRDLQLQKPVLLAYLKRKGFDDDKVNYQTINSIRISTSMPRARIWV